MEVTDKEGVDSDTNHYAVYIFNQDKYLSAPHKSALYAGNTSCDSSGSSHSKSSDTEESNGCLSLLETNVEAEQEMIVRCHLLKNLSVIESACFENEGKHVALKYSDESKQPFGCYYHHLKKVSGSSAEDKDNQEGGDVSCRKVSYFICLICKDDKGMESFCSELGAFCCSFQNYLDPEGHQCQKGLLVKLQHWHFHCVKYVSRCVEKFKDNLVILFQAALWGRIDIECDDEFLKTDLTRFCDACSLSTLLLTNMPSASGEGTQSMSTEEDTYPSIIKLKVIDGKIISERKLSHSAYCKKWVDRLLLCEPTNYVLMKSILESFQLKTVQDLNMLKRLLKKAEDDYYSLYRAYRFLVNSGYEDALIHHVRREAHLTSNEDTIRIIGCLDDFIKEKKQEQKQ